MYVDTYDTGEGRDAGARHGAETKVCGIIQHYRVTTRRHTPGPDSIALEVRKVLLLQSSLYTRLVVTLAIWVWSVLASPVTELATMLGYTGGSGTQG